MKTIIFFTVFVMSSISMAAATCPGSASKVTLCKSTPKAGDQDVAANIFDSIAICQQGPDVLLSMEKNGDVEAGYAKVTQRVGGTTYTLETKDVNIALSVTSGIRTNESLATLTINFISADIKASSTYTCVR